MKEIILGEDGPARNWSDRLTWPAAALLAIAALFSGGDASSIPPWLVLTYVAGAAAVAASLPEVLEKLRWICGSLGVVGLPFVTIIVALGGEFHIDLRQCVVITALTTGVCIGSVLSTWLRDRT